MMTRFLFVPRNAIESNVWFYRIIVKPEKKLIIFSIVVIMCSFSYMAKIVNKR